VVNGFRGRDWYWLDHLCWGFANRASRDGRGHLHDLPALYFGDCLGMVTAASDAAILNKWMSRAWSSSNRARPIAFDTSYAFSAATCLSRANWIRLCHLCADSKTLQFGSDTAIGWCLPWCCCRSSAVYRHPELECLVAKRRLWMVDDSRDISRHCANTEHVVRNRGASSWVVPYGCGQ